jgi:hypothetical protein
LYPDLQSNQRLIAATRTAGLGSQFVPSRNFMNRSTLRTALRFSLLVALALCCHPAAAQGLPGFHVVETFHVDGRIGPVTGFHVLPLYTGESFSGTISILTPSDATGPLFFGDFQFNAGPVAGGVSGTLQSADVTPDFKFAGVEQGNGISGVNGLNLDNTAGEVTVHHGHGGFFITGIDPNAPPGDNLWSVRGTFGHVSSVPEPASMSLLGAGLLPLGLGWWRRHRRHRLT